MTTQDKDSLSNTDTVVDDYDSPWKEAIEHYFPDFMQFYFPEAAVQIDWSKGYEFLDQELRALSQDAELGKRFVDKLVKVMLLDGAEKWIYIHVEVQGSRQQEFAKRIFVYNYRIFDRYDRPVASMAVLADEHAQWKPSTYGFEVLGCKHWLEFPVAKLTDYREQLEDLLIADNPFAIITAAHILTQRTRKDDQERFKAKQQLVRLLYQRQWDKQRIIDLFTVIDWLMRLPEGLDQQLWYEIETIEQEKAMRYVTSVERIGIAKGVQQGLEQGLEQGLVQGLVQGVQQGLEQGLEQGIVKGESKLLQKFLELRFGDLPAWVVEQLNHANEELIEQWLVKANSATDLDSVFEGIKH